MTGAPSRQRGGDDAAAEYPAAVVKHDGLSRRDGALGGVEQHPYAAAHFYQVAAASDGLVAYWKFDEGAGKTIKDQTSYGNDLTVEKELKWVNVSLPELGK